MKQIMLFMLAFLFFNMYAQSQETDTRKERKRIKTEQKQMKNLDLNDNQGQQIKEINSRYRDAHKQIMQNDALTQEQKQEQIQALNKKRVADIHMIVGKDKEQEFDRIHQNEKEKKKVKEEKKNEKMEKPVKEKKEKKSKKG
jgi:hypothetical protein